MGEWAGNCGWVGNCGCGCGRQCLGKLDSKIKTILERRHFPQTRCNLHSKEVFFIMKISSFGCHFHPLLLY